MTSTVGNEPAEVLTKFKAILPQQCPLYDSKEHPDDLLLRFLKARKFDLEKSMLMFNNYLQWRQSFGVEDIVNKFVYPEYDKVMELYPRFYHKLDKLGRPVYFEVLGGISLKAFESITTTDRFVQYYVREYEKTGRYRFAAASGKAGHIVDKSCTIMDLKNVPLMQFNSIRKFLAQVAHIAQNYYPETLGKMFIINAPMLFQTCWAIIKGMLDEATVAKISILGTSYQKELLEVVDAANLPAEYGGSCQCAKGCRHSDVGPWNDGSVAGFPNSFWEDINKRGC
ncbi:cytosolic factor, phosphatidylinositol/phosphatidylcholine transfer protein [Chytriomyces hyalinus]|nr:cytosolic factor, phosphatidylinositol/phosphatidylcholine transfer protein [Chytriomyces hyalinus]